MSSEQHILDIPVSIGYPLINFYDNVNLRSDKLEAILPSLDLELAQLSDTHIHLGGGELQQTLSVDSLVAGQCIKVIDDSENLEEQEREEEEQSRAAYVNYLIPPGLPKEKIANTTFVVLDMAGIAVQEFLKIHGLIKSGPSPVPRSSEPTMKDLDRAIRFESSRVLMHELLHVPIPAVNFDSEEELAEHRANEESFIDEKLTEIGSEGVPSRLVDVKLSRKFTDMGSLAMMLQSLQNHRRATPATS